MQIVLTHMKQLLLIFLTPLFQTAHAQQIYGSLSGGYQIILQQDQPPSYMINSHHGITSPWFWRKEKLAFKQISIAKLKFGYELNERLGIEFSGSFLNASKVQEVTLHTSHTLQGSFWRLTPSFVLNLPTESLDFYARIGVGLTGGKIRYNQLYNSDYPANSFTENTLEYEYTGPISVGFNTSLGTRKRINKNIILFAEIEFIYQNFSPDKGYTTRYEFDGQDQLALYDYGRRDTEIEFGEEQALSGYHIKDENIPEKLYKRNYSLSGFAFNIGIRFDLWSKNDDKEE